MNTIVDKLEGTSITLESQSGSVTKEKKTKNQIYQHTLIAIMMTNVGLAFSANEPQSNFIPHAKF